MQQKQRKPIEAFVMANEAEVCRAKLLRQYPNAVVYVEPTKELARAKVVSLQSSGIMALSVEYGGNGGFEHGN